MSHFPYRLLAMKPAFFIRTLRAPAGLLLVLSSSVFGQNTGTPPSDSDAQQSAYRSSIAEESVRKQTDKIQAEITELLTEMKLNGLDNADTALLASASGHLQTLSQDDMQKVINALQSASMNTQAGDRQQAMVSASEEQKQVSLKLKSLAADLAGQESQKEIPSKLENLIARQSANMRQTATLTGSADQLNAQQKTTHDLVSSEQTSIGGEIDLLFKVLAATPPAPVTEGAPPDISKTVLDAMNGSPLKDASGAAIQLTSTGPFPDAVTKQTAVRDGLIAALRASLANVDAVTRLEEVKAQLNQIISDQKDLAGVTQESKLDGSTLAERQAKINDRTSVTQALLKPINATASGQVDQAQQAMAQTSDALTKAKNPTDTAPQEQAVVDGLTKAAAMLDEQIAAAQKQEAASPADKLAQLQQLQNEINQAQKNPQATAADLQKLQQAALTPSPQAASKIADAADQLQKPQPDAAAAQQSLAQANDAVQKQEDALKQAAQAYQALQQASQALDKAQQQTAAANQAIQDNKTNDLTQAAHDLAQAQANVDQAKAATQAQAQAQAQTPPPAATDPANPTTPPAGLPPDAQQALQQASDALKNATNQAVQAQGAQAQAQAQQAMAAMQKAQAGLGQAMAQMQQQGQGQGQGQGQPGQPGQKQQGQSTQAMAADAPDSQSGLLGGIGTGGTAQVIGGLKAKDREAISQFQAEKSPPEYAPLVQQYLKNLADSSGKN